MRIIIKPTEKNDLLPFHVRVDIMVPSDDIDFGEAVDLVRSALLAWGYLPKTVSDFFDKE